MKRQGIRGQIVDKIGPSHAVGSILRLRQYKILKVKSLWKR
jgi:hypothetical protein